MVDELMILRQLKKILEMEKYMESEKIMSQLARNSIAEM